MHRRLAIASLVIAAAGLLPAAFAGPVPAAPAPPPGVIETVAGGTPGTGSNPASHLYEGLTGAAISGDTEYVLAGGVAVKYDVSTGVVSRVAGTSGRAGFSGDGGPATDATFNNATAIAVDAAGDVFIADTGNNRVREVDHATGTIGTIAGNGAAAHAGMGGPAAAASVNQPSSLAVAPNGDLYIGEIYGDVDVVDHATQVLTVAAGGGAPLDHLGDGGPATSAEVVATALTVDTAGDLYIADAAHQRIRRVDHSSHDISTVAGSAVAVITSCGTYCSNVTFPGGASGDGGPATAAKLDSPAGVALDASGNLYIADTHNNRVREVDHSSHLIATVAGNGTPSFDTGDGGPATAAGLFFPTSLVVDGDGDLLVNDGELYGAVRRVDHSSLQIGTVFGSSSLSATNGDQALGASLGWLQPITTDAAGNVYFDAVFDKTVQRIDAATGVVTTVAGGGTPVSGNGDGGLATDASLESPTQIAISPGGAIYIADANGARVRKVDPTTHVITTVAGNGTWGVSGNGGPATSAELEFLQGLAVDSHGNLFIGEQQAIRRVDHATGIITAYAGAEGRVGKPYTGTSGDGGPALAATIDIRSLAIDASGSLLLANGYEVRRIDSQTGIITTVAGTGGIGASGDGGPATSATLWPTSQVAVDARGDLYIGGGPRVRRVDAYSGVISTVAGGGTPTDGLGDGGPATGAAMIVNGVALDAGGNLLIADAPQNLGGSGVSSRLREVGGGVTPVPATPDQALADAWIADFLGRPATAAETSAGSALLAAHVAPATVLAGITVPNVVKAHQIIELYHQLLGRDPSTAALASRVKSETVDQTAVDLLASAEFLTRSGGSTDAWVQAVYDVVLHRAPSADRLAHWAALTQTAGRATVAEELYQSLEARQDRVVADYQALIHRPPSAVIRDHWAAIILTRGSDPLRAGVATSAEYRSLAVSRFG